MANLTINGKTISVDVEDDTPLLWAIRENVGLTGTKYGCGIAQCGACTVHIDGVAMRSCGILVSEAVGKQITTIEGLAVDGVLHKVQQAWINNDVPQCGYCQSGMIMAGCCGTFSRTTRTIRFRYPTTPSPISAVAARSSRCVNPSTPQANA